MHAKCDRQGASTSQNSATACRPALRSTVTTKTFYSHCQLLHYNYHNLLYNVVYVLQSIQSIFKCFFLIFFIRPFIRSLKGHYAQTLDRLKPLIEFFQPYGQHSALSKSTAHSTRFQSIGLTKRTLSQHSLTALTQPAALNPQYLASTVQHPYLAPSTLSQHQLLVLAQSTHSAHGTPSQVTVLTQRTALTQHLVSITQRT